MRNRTLISNSFRGGLAAVVLVVSCSGLSACKKKEIARAEPEPSTYSTPIAPPPSAPAGIQFSELRVGKELNADKAVATDLETFAPGDTIYASVATTGLGTATPIRARWTFADGQVVADDTRTISGTGNDRTEFHIAKPDGFPAGSYKVEVFIDGRSVMNRNFSVR